AHAADPAIPLTVTTLYNQVSVAWAGLSKTPLQRSSQWGIERLFLVLKEGCRVEALQLGTVARLERAFALFLVVGWRIARLMRLGRTVPDLEASLLFEPEEWQAAYILAKKPVPKSPPRLNDVLRLIARQGGFLGRKGDGEPGVKTIWLGLQRIRDVAAGIKYARESHDL
ncbi:IS4 family transposase, partial [Allochromatium vinosum]|uniref:IS4 family transposase n=1 Tax=Allochromatium vinosum TaxID=1049 RepID=UPI00237A4496